MVSSKVNLRILFIGDSGVGKTTIKNRLMGIGNGSVKTTVGVELSHLPLKIGNHDISFYIFDIGGQSHYSGIRTAYYKDPHLIVAVYDLSNKTSLTSLLKWIREVKETVGRPALDIILVGNKMDLVEKDDENLLEFVLKQIEELGVNIRGQIRVSAKEGTNIKELYTMIVRESLKALIRKK